MEITYRELALFLRLFSNFQTSHKQFSHRTMKKIDPLPESFWFFFSKFPFARWKKLTLSQKMLGFFFEISPCLWMRGAGFALSWNERGKELGKISKKKFREKFFHSTIWKVFRDLGGLKNRNYFSRKDFC